ncbi:vanadium-dependent haloperoxidase [Sabulilitoribacter arenilitoris]|uniref:Vanadium-dependent haloperoxidase n=1 Tax=Wocania arenilitoris TaxID=2044858 RepID=A0AAE3EPY7_9FLAO|nr:vanadium-dependent haloperoxidase [Wocania arenilitoris]MCF7568054.1 vanadium-dependent haloperoxidase [Wocania arenilitoris]
MRFIKVPFLLFLVVLITFSCSKNNPKPIIITSNDFHASVDQVIEVMVHDIFSPPVASRIFVYPNIAAYEIIAQNDSTYHSLKGQINHLKHIPKSDENINYQLAALIAHIDVSKKLIFSEQRIEAFRDSLYQIWEAKNKSEFEASKQYALQVSNFIAEWMNTDNYNQTRTMSKFDIEPENEERWQPTPPAYMDGLEPHWGKIRPFVIDSASQFKPVPPPSFSMDEGSDFHKELKEVYNISNLITEDGDESEEVLIARFWDCNPYVSVTRGHLMFAVKKITPGAHWIGITKIACKTEKSDFNRTVFAYTKTSIAIADAFISCWDEKYRSNLVRPETLINKYWDDDWKPILQTPPFPEYTSGHSVVSNAAATVLTDVFGDNFSFLDDTETTYGLPIRPFTSFNAAAQEAAISRMYGGIHYRSAVELGIGQGKKIGNLVNKRLMMEN